MGYRGSKSVLFFNIVKEQRVDGSWCIIFKSLLFLIMHLRCTLMVFERNYQVKIHTKQSTLSNLLKIITKKLNNRVMVMSR